MSSLPPDPFKILGVEKTADKLEIRAAYKKLVLKCHPDKVQDPTLKAKKQDEFQSVQQAYELLNDDAERTKYEDQVHVMELRKRAAMTSKTAPNTSASRTPKHTYAFDVRPAKARYETAASPTAPSATKMYAHYSTTHTRSYEEVPSRTSHAVYDAEPRSARRTASSEYPKTSRRDEERPHRGERDRDERRRRKEEDEKDQIRLTRKADKKRTETHRRREAEEKTRRHRDPYVEQYEEVEEVFVAPTPEKKKPSNIKKHEEIRARSTPRRAESPRDETRESKTKDYVKFAASYIENHKIGTSSPSYHQETFPKYSSPPSVPSPPPMDGFEEPSLHRAAVRAAGRRTSTSNETPKKEKMSSRKQRSREELDDGLPPRIPTFSKSHTTPIMVSASPPRVGRSNTAQDGYSRPVPQPPSFSRTKTWAAGEGMEQSLHDTAYTQPYYEPVDSEEERRPRRSRRNQEAVRYKVTEDNKTSKIDSSYSYDESPPARRYPPGFLHSRSTSSAYANAPFKVKTAPSYGVDDVKYSDVPMSNPSTQYAFRPPPEPHRVH